MHSVWMILEAGGFFLQVRLLQLYHVAADHCQYGKMQRQDVVWRHWRADTKVKSRQLVKQLFNRSCAH